MAKSTSVALAIGAVLAGGAVIAGAPLVAAPAGAVTTSATMSAQHDLVRFGHPHARGQRNRNKGGHRHNQRLREQQRQHQFLMRDLTLVLVPYQKETTDAAALPYNWQNDSTSVQQYGNQDLLTTAQDTPRATEINVDGGEGNSTTTVSPKTEQHDVDHSSDVNVAVDDKVKEPAGGPQGDLVTRPVPTAPVPTAPTPTTPAATAPAPTAPVSTEPVPGATSAGDVPQLAVDPAPAAADPGCSQALTLPLTLSLTATVSLAPGTDDRPPSAP
ncbi:hypothetical protein ACQPZZ_39280 [Microbispora sp. CA-135349]|uniref:hypothetical protein n=1 Tax=Microbispora sp. CA-135349 TaxID=3239953 RepID=UPI003D93D18A